jgi:hypothetical protein
MIKKSDYAKTFKLSKEKLCELFRKQKERESKEVKSLNSKKTYNKSLESKREEKGYLGSKKIKIIKNLCPILSITYKDTVYQVDYEKAKFYFEYFRDLEFDTPSEIDITDIKFPPEMKEIKEEEMVKSFDIFMSMSLSHDFNIKKVVVDEYVAYWFLYFGYIYSVYFNVINTEHRQFYEMLVRMGGLTSSEQSKTFELRYDEKHGDIYHSYEFSARLLKPEEIKDIIYHLDGIGLDLGRISELIELRKRNKKSYDIMLNFIMESTSSIDAKRYIKKNAKIWSHFDRSRDVEIKDGSRRKFADLVNKDVKEGLEKIIREEVPIKKPGKPTEHERQISELEEHLELLLWDT